MLKKKAARNLQAGEILAAAGLVDPAASRFYYAMFQAAVHRLTVIGWTPGQMSSGALRWSHTAVQNNVFLVRRRPSDRRLFAEMRKLRELADYGDDAVDTGQVAARAAAVREFVAEATQ